MYFFPLSHLICFMLTHSEWACDEEDSKWASAGVIVYYISRADRESRESMTEKKSGKNLLVRVVTMSDMFAMRIHTDNLCDARLF